LWETGGHGAPFDPFAGMRNLFADIFCAGSPNMGRKIVGIYAVLIGFNAVAWGWALVAFRDHPVLLGTALLAYSFGLRHAVDADHIAAIDNVTRKLMQEGKRPIAVGFFFSLGHSTVVFLLCIAIAMATLRMEFDSLKEIGGVIGTSVSALFLFAIAIANIFILISLYHTFAAGRQGWRFAEEDLDVILATRGFLARRLEQHR
jgi:nickel/cobalt transporter (NiCoT) family protein